MADVDCWFSVQPIADRVETGRGTARDVIGLRALYVDLDVKQGGMPSYDAARAVVGDLSAMLGVEPVAVVWSGHGVQPYWQIERGPGTDWPDDPDDPCRARAAVTLRRFGRLADRVAHVHGGAVDSVWDLPRVLRVPGTTNRKDEAKPAHTALDVGKGAPVSLDRVAEVLEDYDVAWEEDDEHLGEVVAPAGDWAFAETTCSYVTKMITGWASDKPAARHPWLVGQATRLAAAHRLGCISETEHGDAIATLTERFRQLLKIGNARAEGVAEISDALSWGVGRVEAETDEQARRELGDHHHDGERGQQQQAPHATSPPIIRAEAFYGVIGEIVETTKASTEADPAAILGSLVCGVGVLMGPTPYLQIGSTRHVLILWPLLFGRTGSGRKGEATNTAEVFLEPSHPDFVKLRTSGLSSGEGLIEAIRDPTEVKHGKVTETVGTTDKRLFVVEPEFASVMARAKREGNTLAAVLRQAWDGRALSTLNRSPLKAKSSHVGIVGHVTPREFRLRLAEAEMSGGLYNRFLPIWSERAHLLPIPPVLSTNTIKSLAEKLHAGIANAAKTSAPITLTADAEALWRGELYPRYAGMDDSDEAWVEFSRRAAPNCLRVAAIYAVLDGRRQINHADLRAAAALVDFSMDTARYVLGNQSKDPRLDRLRRALDASPDGLTRSEVSKVFGHNASADVLDELLSALLANGGYEQVDDQGDRGRPSTVYRRTKETK
jgi:hypothetical protein